MGLTEALEEAVAQHPDVVALAKHASITLANVSESGEAVALLLMDGALDFVLHLMDRWPENEEVQVCAALLGRTERPINQERDVCASPIIKKKKRKKMEKVICGVRRGQSPHF